MGSFGKTALSGQISGFSPQGKWVRLVILAFGTFAAVFSFSFSIIMFLTSLLNCRHDVGSGNYQFQFVSTLPLRVVNFLERIRSLQPQLYIASQKRAYSIVISVPSTGYGAQGAGVFFLSFFKIIFHLLPPSANRFATHVFLSSLDAIVLAVFEKVILVFFQIHLAF